jgi:hypothetical protein
LVAVALLIRLVKIAYSVPSLLLVEVAEHFQAHLVLVALVVAETTFSLRAELEMSVRVSLAAIALVQVTQVVAERVLLVVVQLETQLVVLVAQVWLHQLLVHLLLMLAVVVELEVLLVDLVARVAVAQVLLVLVLEPLERQIGVAVVAPLAVLVAQHLLVVLVVQEL